MYARRQKSAAYFSFPPPPPVDTGRKRERERGRGRGGVKRGRDVASGMPMRKKRGGNWTLDGTGAGERFMQ